MRSSFLCDIMGNMMGGTGDAGDGIKSTIE